MPTAGLQGVSQALVPLVVSGLVVVSSVCGIGQRTAIHDSAESRALAYLAREVPRWSAENGCFSCHNNGDGARALYTAVRLARPVPAESLKDTTAWLAAPQRWDQNGGDGPFSDKRLARIQFAAALRAAVAAGSVRDRNALEQAAQQVAADQGEDGSWLRESLNGLGSPATYGRPLATYLALETLRAADADRFGAQIKRADAWLIGLEIHNVLDAAAVLLAMANTDGAEGASQRQRALELIRKGQSPDGGWGPFVSAAPEPFDTSVVLLALAQAKDRSNFKAMLQSGRAFLIEQQLPDGSWMETTRPAGAESYAQRLSTTAWATMALLKTQSDSKP